MTRNKLLEDLKEYSLSRTSHLSLPTSIQKGDTEQLFRAPEVFKMRLPNSAAAKKIAPYILIQFVSGMDKQTHGSGSESASVVRFIFCVYADDEQEGAAMLLNVMDCIRIGLLQDIVIAEQYKLDTDQGIETLIYPDDTAPYYAGEMICTFSAPPIERKVDYGC